MEPSQGKKIGFVLGMLGAVAAFGGVRLLETTIVGGGVLVVVGLAVLWFGFTIRDVSAEVEYERDVLD